MRPLAPALLLWAMLLPSPAAQERAPDDSPAGAREWGIRPAAGATVQVTPPAFCWRPERGIASWEIEVRSGEDPVYAAEGIEWNVHCPPRVLAPGDYTWRRRGRDRRGRPTAWSGARPFRIAPGAAALPLPARADLLARIPTSHPRLFLRPGELPRLRRLAAGKLEARARDLRRRCRALVERPPSTEEPPRYPAGVKRRSEAWRRIWWGNRVRTVKALEGAATLGFGSLLWESDEYGELGRRLLLACARWDPRGSTGYRYNDEAGMPYAYHFSRAYTFLHGRLTEEERALCRRVMRIRGSEMYRHLCPRHLWRPYSSHSNRAWHFLGEVGIAFLGEIEEAGQWAWFAANVFRCVYPVWSDAGGGWHEGAAYWRSYLGRFTWWADVMRAAMGIDAYRKPFFARAGDYGLYLLPPGKVGGGFGDLTARIRPRHILPLMTVLAVQGRNPHWQWWVEKCGGPRPAGGYIGLVRGALPRVEPRPPGDLPASRLFAGTGQAVLNSRLDDAAESVQLVFKSSPFGTQSHGYEANNSFLLWGYGERLLIRTGRRDIYGSRHHQWWMWSTRSTNCITVGGRGQQRHSAAARGRITGFHTSPALDLVMGEAGGAWRPQPLERFTRTLVFAKPGLVVVHDLLETEEPAACTWWLHGRREFEVRGQEDIRLATGKAGCRICFHAPEGLAFAQTDQYDPNPRPRVKLREWHLQAKAPGKRRRRVFLTSIRPHRRGEEPVAGAVRIRCGGGSACRFALADGELLLLLPRGPRERVAAFGLTATGAVVARRRDGAGRVIATARIPLPAAGGEDMR